MFRYTLKSCSICCKIFKMSDQFWTLYIKGAKLVFEYSKSELIVTRCVFSDTHGCFSRFLNCTKVPNRATHHIYTLERVYCRYIETSPLICSANQWTGFYMITI